MRKFKLVLFVFIIQLLIIFPVIGEVEFTEELFYQLADNVNEIPYIENPEYIKVELNNGMIIYLAEDNKLPIVEVRGFIKGGLSQENPDQADISSIMTKLMNTGTQNYSERELTRYKELNGISFSISASFDRYSFSANSLASEQDELISIMAEILRKPKFEGDYFNRIKQEYYQSIMQQYYNDGFLVDMFFNKTLYGNHPYSHYYDIDMITSSLQNMTPVDVEKFYNENIDPANMIMAISGDINIKEMKTIIEEYFGDWESQGVELRKKEVDVNEENFNRIILVNKEDATHAKMKIGYNFHDSSFDDRTPFIIANRIFGLGDFSSRLMDNLRTKLGYVYGVSSDMSLRQFGGLYYISTDVAPTNAYDAREAIIAEFMSVVEGENPIQDKELFRIVNQYNAFFPQSYKDQINVLTDIMFDIEIMGKDEDPINNFIQEYNNLSASEVQEVFVKNAYPERFLTVIVGRKDEVLPSFEEKGIKVEVIELF